MRYSGALLFSLLLLVGCSFREQKEGGSPLKGTGNISFARIQSEILKPSCVGCHSGMHAPNLASFSNVKANLQSLAHAVLEKKSMPKAGPLPEGERELLAQWIENGAPEFGEIPDPIPTEPTGGQRPPLKWDTLVKEVLRPKCFNCHFPSNPENISNLDDYEIFVGTVGTSYFVTVINPLMPPPPKDTPEGEPNPNKLTRSEMEMFSNWIVDGMQK